MVGSIFRIDKIECDNDKIWNVRLILCPINDKQLKYFFRYMKNNLGTGKTSLLQFRHIFHLTRKVNYSEKHYRRCLNQLSNNHPDISSCYNALGMIA